MAEYFFNFIKWGKIIAIKRMSKIFIDEILFCNMGLWKFAILLITAHSLLKLANNWLIGCFHFTILPPWKSNLIFLLPFWQVFVPKPLGPNLNDLSKCLLRRNSPLVLKRVPLIVQCILISSWLIRIRYKAIYNQQFHINGILSTVRCLFISYFFLIR